MAQHDYVLDDASGAVFRADLNAALSAIATLNSGGSAPSTTYAYMWWADTTNAVLKQRNSANSAWIIRSRLAAEGLVTKSSGFTVGLADHGKVFECTVAITIAITAAATLADGFWFGVRNSMSAGNVTVDPNASELIDGDTTRVFGPSESGLIYCNGSAFKTIGRDNQLIGDTGSGGTRGLVPAPASGDAAANKFLKADGTWTAVTSFRPKVAIVSDQQAANTGGGTPSASAWTKRTINAEESDADALLSLSSSVIALTAGTYLVRGWSTFTENAQEHRLRLRNTSDGTTACLSATGRNREGGGSVNLQTPIEGRFTIASTKNFELQYYCAGSGSNGLGVASNLDSQVEIYTRLVFEKLA